MRYQIYDASIRIRCKKAILEAFRGVVGEKNVSSIIRNFMKETVEKAKKPEEKTD